MNGHGVKTDPQGNIFEGEWKEGKPQLKGEKGKGLADLLPWLNETVAPLPRASAAALRAPAPARHATRRRARAQVGNVPTPQGRAGGYESVLTDDPDDRH